MTAPTPPFWLTPDEGEPIPAIGTLKVSASHTGGAYEVFEFVGREAPAHVHRGRDEVFFVLAGSYTFLVGEQTIPGPPGSLVFVSRGVPHGFRSSEGSRALLIVAPSGLESYFRDLGAGLGAGRSPADLRRELGPRHDSELVEGASPSGLV